ncbi:MAG: protein-disulfide isomerase [Parcubacteria group bacterium]|nr:protein-disulfide isomerase [Parcubacteria group bacterium]
MTTDGTKGLDKGEFMEKYLTPIAVLLGALIIGGALIFGHGGTKQADTTAGQPMAVDIKDVKDEGEPYIGNKNAPVVMAYWFDYQCPFCKQFEQTTMMDLNTKYVETGKVKILLKDFQFLGEDSDTAALFARAVWDVAPDHFYEWFKAVFAAQDDEGDVGFGDLASITALTRSKVPSIDTDKVLKVMNDKKDKFTASIAADRDEATAFGINGTPSYIIGTGMLSGAQPTAQVSALIDAELAK